MKKALIIIFTTAVLTVLVLARGLLYDAWNTRFGPAAKERALQEKYSSTETPEKIGPTAYRNGVVPKGYPKELYPLLSNIGLEGGRYRYPTGTENVNVAYRVPGRSLGDMQRSFEEVLGKNGWIVENRIQEPAQFVMRLTRGLDAMHVVLTELDGAKQLQVEVLYSRNPFTL
jgi:hypothetical protein